MNTETNKFEEITPEREEEIKKANEGSPPGQPKFIHFDIGQLFSLNGYMFKIKEINVSQNRLVLMPVGFFDHVRTMQGIKGEK